MNKKLTVTLATIVLSASVMSFGSQAFADEAINVSPVQAVVAQTEAKVYPLTDALNVEVKSVLNERILEGTRIGVVVKMGNSSAAVTRVPEYELRAVTSEGTVYTLQSSASNPKAIQPKTTTDLSYMVVLDRTDKVTLSEVNWTDVDVYVYPKKETLITAIPVTTQPWSGVDTPITDPTAVRKWADSFQIPTLVSPIQYTPIDIHKESTAQGNVYVVQLLAHNPSAQRETIPEFTIDGRTDAKVFSGKKVEEGTIALDAKEDKYIHYVIPTDQDTVLSSLNLLTTESFAQSGATAANVVQYQVGRLNILLPGSAAAQSYSSYALGSIMKFDTRSELIHPDMQVSLVEFQMSDNEDEGSKQVTAKFRLYNRSDRPLAIPVFQTELVSSDGYQYSGKRQTMTTTTVLPNSGITVNYAYILPSTETGKGLGLKIQDTAGTKTAGSTAFKSTIASYGVQLQAPSAEDKFSMYPFDVAVEHWDISYLFNTSTHQYTYKGKFLLDIQRQKETQVDANFPRLQFELYDATGRLVASAAKSLIGQERLVSGENNISFAGTSEQFDSPLTLKIYEIFTTESGEFKRLVTEFSRPFR
ncbi:hypothetical protein [Paenibacillus radicis (ex Xue et al. 2023)]|uniref:DUF4139 domain-containing protein n=1 Tax=Paenibacillus radicis (ex Xue et al. 2023) TaxID=2972489 RepID=A0ABT1YG14_9BACL|nr:hypothetical protein [Paenibacillus radicis (ex Xue et al. 2023)]MCR8631655.1 hypothetical protein [Paenibacillus radicis (ex Xue et al. 2023)]